MRERRKLKRKRLLLFLSVVDHTSDTFIGRLMNINTNGMMVMSNKLIKPNSGFIIRIEFPTTEGKSRRIICEAHSVWCRDASNADFFACGFEFKNISSFEMENVSLLIEEFCVDE
jgi:hypothetical protein